MMFPGTCGRVGEDEDEFSKKREPQRRLIPRQVTISRGCLLPPSRLQNGGVSPWIFTCQYVISRLYIRHASQSLLGGMPRSLLRVIK